MGRGGVCLQSHTPHPHSWPLGRGSRGLLDVEWNECLDGILAGGPTAHQLCIFGQTSSLGTPASPVNVALRTFPVEVGGWGTHILGPFDSQILGLVSRWWERGGDEWEVGAGWGRRKTGDASAASQCMSPQVSQLLWGKSEVTFPEAQAHNCSASRQAKGDRPSSNSSNPPRIHWPGLRHMP